MSVTPECIFSEAKELCENVSCEVSRRNAAARAYYSFFHFALRYADSVADIPVSSLNGSTHSKLADFFSSSHNHAEEKKVFARKVGILLRSAHKTRCIADYNLDRDFDCKMFDMHIKECNKGVQEISNA